VVLRFLDAPPPERLLIADFRENHNPLALTSGSLCQIGIQSGSFTANYNSAFTGSQTCTLIAGNRQYEELGYLEALFHFSEISPNDPESSAFIHMQTNIAGIVLDVGCGIQYDGSILRPYLSIATLDHAGRLICPPDSGDDPTDERCIFELRPFPMLELEQDQNHLMRLTTNPRKPNVFECMYDDGIQPKQDEYYVDLSTLLSGNSLDGASFSRLISVDFADTSAMTISIDDIYEGSPPLPRQLRGNEYP
jgi:hypothetical protein